MLGNESSSSEIELLRKRSLRMLAHARECLKTHDYDLASFLAEQSVQLYIKSCILKLTGEVPRTHSIRQLLHILRGILGGERALKIDSFVSKYRRLISGLEEAYLASRYLFRIYDENESKELVDFAEEAIRFVEDLGV